MTKNNASDLNGLFKAVYGVLMPGPKTTVEQWLKFSYISQEEADKYPNALIAKQIQDSPLANTMREEFDKK